MSEKALKYLAQSDFKAGLVAGVALNIPVAHKFGEYILLHGNSEIKQLHDCGIIYYPQSPYLLCIMSCANSFEFLDETIRDISRAVFEEVDHQHISS